MHTMMGNVGGKSGIPQYSELPERARKAIDGFIPSDELISQRLAHFAPVQPRERDKDGDTETFDGVTFTHHFVDAPGDAETLNWHYVETGKRTRKQSYFFTGFRTPGSNGSIRCRRCLQDIGASPWT